ncbi:hypothetical protein [Halodesulfovibrio sp.]|uniref:hypothetical protein n=1 Tax=Halodesulfovibrio sp. TaxID=1912772 RepID=UPI0025BC435D|nr:hypothetical protein [Halodesulfovibrio sp.]
MKTLQITILDQNTSKAQQASQHLRTLLKQANVEAQIQEVTCYLEISRRGLQDKTPVIAVNNQNFQCKDLSQDLLAQFAQWLSTLPTD